MSKLNWKLAAALLVAIVVTVAARSQDGDSKASSSSEGAKPQANDAPAKATLTDPSLNAVEAKVVAALQTKVDVDFHEATLVEVAEWATKISGVNVDLDRRAMQDAGIDVSQKSITLKLRGVQLHAALKHMLPRMQSAITMRGGSLVITTGEVAVSTFMTRVYPVADLMTFKRADGKTIVKEDLVVETITTCVEPQSWDSVGGPGSIGVFQGTIIVNQSFAGHENVARLLRQLRSARDRQKNGDFTPQPLYENASELAIEAALAKRTDIELSNVSLAEFAERIAKACDVNVVVDDAALADAGIDTKAPAISEHFKNVPMRDALRRVLGQLELKYVVTNEAILITSLGCGGTVSCAYPIGDFTMTDDRSDDLPSERITELLTSTVAPASWDSVGGPGGCRAFEEWKLLVVSQSADMHEQIADVLTRLRAVKAAQGQVQPEALTPAGEDRVELRVYPLSVSDKAELAIESAKTVEKVIREAVAPESWADPASYLKALPDRIVVRAKRSIHAQVKELLDKLEEARPAPMQTPPSGSGLSGPGPFGGGASK